MIRLSSGKVVILWAGGLLLAMGTAACGGGGEADLTARPINDAMLGTMAVYEVDLPEDFASFVRTGESGFKTNEQSAEGHFDPLDEAQDLESFGQVREYIREYELPEVDGPVTQEGAISFVSGVRLFEDAPGASGYLEDELADIEGSEGKDMGGATIEDVERFKVGGIGDEAAGVRTTMAFRGEESERLAYGTQVLLRRGRLLISITALRADDEDIGEEIKALAGSLDERIQVALQATLVASPTVTQ